MKLLKILLLSMFFTVSAHAETITIIVTGKPGGTFQRREILFVGDVKNLVGATNF